jgi:hypothetical protein
MTEQREQIPEETNQEDEKQRSREESQREGDTAQSAAPDARAESSGHEDVGEEAGSREERAPLLTSRDTESFRRRWENLQAGFVDEPRQMVEQADDLVGELMQQLSAGFSDKRSNLEEQWEKGDDVSTEDLRVALTRYRSFFNRLLSA